MTIHHEDLIAYFPHLEWKISEPFVCSVVGSYRSAEAEIQATEKHGGGHITVIAYEDGQVTAEFRAFDCDDFGCTSFPHSGQTVKEAMQSLREQMEWRSSLIQRALG
jgi:hypothetical protein